MFFMCMKTMPFLLLFVYLRFAPFVRGKSFCKKKSLNCPDDFIYITTVKASASDFGLC